MQIWGVIYINIWENLTSTAVDSNGIGTAALVGNASQQAANKQRVKLKAAFKKPLLQRQKTDSSTLPSTTEEESGSPRTTLDGATACFARSRIGTETSVETSIENPTCIQGY